MSFFRANCVAFFLVLLALMDAGICAANDAADDVQSEHAQPLCKVLRMQPTGMLLGCGPKLVSLLLILDDVSRTEKFTPDGLFHFGCPIESMCNGRPRIDGWMILKEFWQDSKQDDGAIGDVLQLPPAVKGPAPRSDEWLPKTKSVCGTFPITVAGMQGHASCYEEDGTATIASVVAGEEVGFALLFKQPSSNWQSLKDQTIDIAPNFKIQRVEGDSQLIKWLR